MKILRRAVSIGKGHKRDMYTNTNIQTHTCIRECIHMHTVHIPTLSCYSTVVVVKNMLNAQVQADQTDVGSG